MTRFQRLRYRLHMLWLGWSTPMIAGGAEDGGDGGGEGGDDGKGEGNDPAGKSGKEGEGEPAGAEKDPPWGKDEDFDPKRAWSLITGIRSDLDKVRTERDELSGKVKKHEDATKSDQEKLEEAKTTAEQRATKAETDAARLRVALKKGLSETQAKRLVGSDEEELEKDADELLESFKQEDEEGQESQRRPKERLRPGAAPAAKPDESDPAKLAEGVSRW